MSDWQHYAGSVAIVAGLACGVLAMINQSLMIRRRKPGVPWIRSMTDNPYNIWFRPSDLTEDGLRARRRAFWFAIGFVASIAIAFAM